MHYAVVNRRVEGSGNETNMYYTVVGTDLPTKNQQEKVSPLLGGNTLSPP